MHTYRRSVVARAKQASKRGRSKALPVWGAAGMSLAMASGASAAVVPGEKAPSQARLPVFTLGEEELSDVVLSKFFVYDREATASSKLGVQYAQRCGGRCGGCAARGCGGRCGGCGVARCARCGVGVGCAVRRCGGCGVGWVGCAGCTCSCCISWGACQLC